MLAKRYSTALCDLATTLRDVEVITTDDAELQIAWGLAQVFCTCVGEDEMASFDPAEHDDDCRLVAVVAAMEGDADE